MHLRSGTRLFLVIALLLPMSATAQYPPPMPPLPPMPREYASVGISPSYQEVSPGTQLTFTVSAQSTLGGTVSITVPSGLELLGAPACSGPCRGPYVSAGSGIDLIEVTLDGESAVVSFTVSVSSFSRVGDTINIGVTLVGGPRAVEMSSATIYVTQAVPTQPSLPADDNRLLYLDMSPLLLRIAPGGEMLYHIQPVRWGMWPQVSPTVTVDIMVPPGVSAVTEPSCGRGDIAPISAPCETAQYVSSDGSTTYSIVPGYDSSDQSANGIYLTLTASDDVEIGTLLEIDVSATVDDDTLPAQPSPVTSAMQIVAEDSLLVPQSTFGSVGAVLEASQGFTISGSTCSIFNPDSQLGLYEFGLESRFAAATPGTGVLGVATDGSGGEVCHVPVVFNNVPARDGYVFASSYGNDIPCRACIFGTITTGNSAEAVFPLQ